MSKKPANIEDVLRLANAMGYATLPLLIEEKIPAYKWKRVHQQGRPFTAAELRGQWTEKDGKLNPGIATGQPSKVVVVDADNQEGIDYVLKHLPPAEVKTLTRHGAHFHYPMNENGPDVRNGADVLGSKARFVYEAREELDLDLTVHQSRDQSPEELAQEKERAEDAWRQALAKKTMGPLIDIRGTGGQVVAPGAIHPSGFRYKAEGQWTRETLEKTDVYDPAWFAGKKGQRPGTKVADLKTRRAAKELEKARDVTEEVKLKRSAAWLDCVDPAISGAGGHNRTFYAACRLIQGFCVDTDTAFQMLREIYNPKCVPPWSDEELAHKAVDAAQHIGQNYGFMLVEGDSRKKVIVNEECVYDFGEDMPGPEGTEDELVTDGNSARVVEIKPAADLDAYWTQRWARFGVNYQDLIDNDVTWNWRPGKGGTRVLHDIHTNIEAVLRYSRNFGYDVRFNALTKMIELRDTGRELAEGEILDAKAELVGLWNKEIPKGLVRDCLVRMARKNAYEPVQEWLATLPPWDGVKRLETVPTRVLGAKPDTVIGVMFRHFMTSLIARIKDPGCKVDTMLFLVSKKQGAGKSKFFRLLIDGDLKGRKWFTDNPFSLKDKDGRMLIGTNVIIEWSEGEHAKSAKMIDTVKAFLSGQDDKFRPPYGEKMETFPRRCVFVGTSNDIELIHDSTGDRRFYIMETAEKIKLDDMIAEREQLFKEAEALYDRHSTAKAYTPDWHAGRWWFEGIEDDARHELMRQFRSRSAWHEDIENWVEERAIAGKPMFTVDDVIEGALRVTRDKKSRRVADEVRSTLRNINCTLRGQMRVDGRKARYWQAPTADQVAVPDDDLDDIM